MRQWGPLGIALVSYLALSGATVADEPFLVPVPAVRPTVRFEDPFLSTLVSDWKPISVESESYSTEILQLEFGRKFETFGDLNDALIAKGLVASSSQYYKVEFGIAAEVACPEAPNDEGMLTAFGSRIKEAFVPFGEPYCVLEILSRPSLLHTTKSQTSALSTAAISYPVDMRNLREIGFNHNWKVFVVPMAKFGDVISYRFN